MWRLFLLQKTVTIQNILLYDWSITLVRDRRFSKYITLYVFYSYGGRLPLEECSPGPRWI